jgi:HAD superfamily hydrolase (TIGR01509 family)
VRCIPSFTPLAETPTPCIITTVAGPKYKVLFIDFYGTIAAGDAEAVHRICSRLVADFHLTCSPADLAIQWGTRFFAAIDRSNHDQFRTLEECECDSLIETLEPLSGRIDPGPYVAELTEYWSAPPLHPDAVDALADIGIPTFCISNADTRHLRAAIECHSLAFDSVIISQDARCYKPDPEIFHHALDRAGVQSHQALHVGDSLHSDVTGAINAGIDAVWLCRDRRIHDLGNARPLHKISSLKHLRSVLA